MSDHADRAALAFLAHPDDAEIQCGGTLIHLARLGWQVHIATATAGDGGSPHLPPEKISAIRREEARIAADRIGATYHCLELRDVRVCYDRDSIDRAIDLFRRVGPSLVITHPRHDYMLDHEQVHLLARGASFAGPIPNVSLVPRVSGAGIPYLYYCDPVDQQDPYLGVRVAPTTYVDVSDVIDEKLAMLACHQSQREWLRSHHGIDEYLERTRQNAATRGAEIGVGHAEAFVQHRGHPYPQDDLLGRLFASTITGGD